MKTINGNEVIKIGKTMGLETFENEFAFYVKVSNKEYEDISNTDAGFFNTLSKLDAAENYDTYDVLVWQYK